MQTLTALWLTLIFLIGSIVVIPTAPANAWLLPLIFRAAVVNVAKQELRTRYARCKEKPKTCRVKAQMSGRTKAICSRTRLQKTCKKFKHSPADRSHDLAIAVAIAITGNGGF
jgi:hypothetical protein